MRLAARNFVYHLLANLCGRPSIRWPLGAYLYLTYRCNLACIYCNDGLGQKYPDKQIDRELSGPEWAELLRILRRVTDFVIFTGGEPTVRSDLDFILASAKKIGYRPVCLLTNALNLDRHWEALQSVDLLAVSLDTLDCRKGDAILGLPGAHRRILANIKTASQLQIPYRFALCFICCITPDSLPDAEAVLDFALDRGLGFAPAPASAGTAPVPGLRGNPPYETFIRKLVTLKRSGANILGSTAYLQAIHDFAPYRCLPTLLARVKPNGDLLYPCSKQFTVAGNLLAAGDYHALAAQGRRRHGPIGSCEKHCHDGCYMDYSLLVQSPRHLLEELWLRTWRQLKRPPGTAPPRSL